jgi:hypothetical protein
VRNRARSTITPFRAGAALCCAPHVSCATWPVMWVMRVCANRAGADYACAHHGRVRQLRCYARLCEVGRLCVSSHHEGTTTDKASLSFSLPLHMMREAPPRGAPLSLIIEAGREKITGFILVGFMEFAYTQKVSSLSKASPIRV